MKKVFYIYMIFILFYITGCQTDKKDAACYEVMLGDYCCAEGLDIGKCGIQTARYEELKDFTNQNAVQERQLVLSGQQKFLVYDHSETMILCDYTNDVYITSEDDEYSFKSGTDILLSAAKKNMDVPYLRSPGNFTSEQEYKNWIESILKIHFHADLTGLTYSCTTSSFRSSDGGGGKVIYDYFTTSKDPSEEVVHYSFCYTRWISGYQTTDYIQVSTDQDGNIKFINLNRNDFASVTVPEIDQALLAQTLDQTVHKLIAADKYSLKSCDIDSTRLFIKGGTPQLSVTVSLETERKSDARAEHCLCTLYVNPAEIN